MLFITFVDVAALIVVAVIVMAVAVDIIGVVVVIAAVAPMTFLTRHFTSKKIQTYHLSLS